MQMFQPLNVNSIVSMPNSTRNAKPFLKWAGGKQQLLGQLETLLPTHYDRYIEPFVGGGAVYFHLWNTKKLPHLSFLFDNNHELINAYKVVQSDLEELTNQLAIHKSNHGTDYYYQIRNLDREELYLSSIERAARTIYLNKTCYNGLYRVNSNGQFNVPIGSYKDPKILYVDVLSAAHKALQSAHIEVRDFRQIVEISQKGDFFYFDPPYDPVSKTASFTSYTSGNFRDKDQCDLAQIFTELTRRGCFCMLSNSYTPLVLHLYREFRIEIVHANRAINSNGNGRGTIKEVVVINY